MERRDCLKLAATAAALPWPLRSWAQNAPLDVELFTRAARFGQITLSPNGRMLAAIVPVQGRRNLTVIDLETRASSAVTSFTEQDVGGYAWVTNDRLVFWLGVNTQTGLGEQRLGSGLFAVNRDGTEPRVLSSPNPQISAGINRTFRWSAFLSTTAPRPDQPGAAEILVTSNDRNVQFPDVYRMDTRTGRKTLLTDRKPGDATGWWADRRGSVRAAVTTQDKNTRMTLFWRDSDDAPWQAQVSWDPYSADAVEPQGFDADGSLLVSAAHQGRLALFRWDTVGRKPGDRIAAHPEYDITGGLVRSSETGQMIGLRVDAERLETYWFDEDHARAQAAIDRALPGKVNLLSRPSAQAPFLVTSASDRDPGRWYLFDPAKRQLEEVVAAAPWLPADRLAERKFVRYAARDGLSIPAYLTLPPGPKAGPRPVVVLVHGGPYVRGERWNYDPESQFLASRGYVVLQADFRGSKGYGHAHYKAGWKQWGLAMQDDLNDGLAWLVSQGLADPKRAALVGGSYGGYAVMMGLARDPDLWACGVNVVGVTDLDLLVSATWSDTAQWDGHEHFFATHLGDPKADRARFDATSPARNLSRIKSPLLMAYGAGDQRVPIEHATRIEGELKALGRDLELVVYKDEGHGFLRQANRLDYYRRMEAFLARHLKPQA